MKKFPAICLLEATLAVAAVLTFCAMLASIKKGDDVFGVFNALLFGAVIYFLAKTHDDNPEDGCVS